MAFQPLQRSGARRGERRWRANLLPILIAVMLAFGAGVGVGRGGVPLPPQAGAESSLTGTPQFAELQATWDLIHSKWADPASVDDAALLYGAASGMVDALGDEGHSRFLDPNAAKDFEDQTSGQFVGIGVEIDLRGGLPVVVAPLDDSPALKAGIRSGDTIIDVNGQSLEMMTLDEVGKLIRGEPGTPVTLRLQHLGNSAPYQVTVTRQKINIDPVTWRMLPGGVAQVRISEFSSGATRELKNVLAAVRQQGGRAIVLDLRDNPGGLVSEAVGVSSQFMDEGKTIFQQKERDKAPLAVKTVGRDGLWLDRPLVVLVNRGSASAAEIVGGALRDNGRALLLGETTFGTGTVLAPFQQPDGSIVLLGTALWLTADGQQIWKQGVVPDETVQLPFDQVPSRPAEDRQITAAKLFALPDTQLRAGWDAAARDLAPAITRGPWTLPDRAAAAAAD
ncbi:MAG TPA: S41 family peptidase [Thermomicrobiales bacterium]|nr:S41 family peptidase [Thermomicrobiales bacterium]